ncbi:MAG: hypothetical protein JO291_01550 [Acidimicrobiia bacterium]|nr:hypothetical protein [Acidimicrobiia bacterium]
MTTVIVILIAVFVALYPDDGSGNKLTKAETATTQPRIIRRPEDGVAPEGPGDPGGWEQLALLGVIVAGVGVVGGLVWRASRKARAAAGAPPTPGAAARSR